ncbi:MAG: DNA-binding protein [Kiritimatiellae bacterium]|nr:DNA-binding protein [Kiritimatiellia bacterium]
MKYEQAGLGRVFVLRLEDGDIVHEVIEKFAAEQKIRAASVIVVGGADKGSRLVVGPENGRSDPPISLIHTLDDAHEVAGTGTLFPDEEGNPFLHLHLAAGRGDRAVTGCARVGVKTWHVLEVVLVELTGSRGVRRLDPKLGFKLLDPEGP